MCIEIFPNLYDWRVGSHAIVKDGNLGTLIFMMQEMECEIESRHYDY